MNRKQSWNIVTIFLLLIFGFTAASLLKPDTEFSENENRSLAQKPALSWDSLLSGAFSQEYEEYLTDQFLLRDQWIGLKTKAERLTFRQEINDVYFAADDYLIEKHTGTFETDRAKANITFLASFFEKMKKTYDTGHLTAMVVPNAVDILRDKLPPFASPYDEEQYLDQIEAALPREVWFDASSVLRQHKEEPVYYRTDHHWKTLGAFYVFEQWAEEKNLGQISEEDFRIETVTDSFEGTIASKVGTEVVPDTIELYRPREEVPYLLTYNQSDDIRSSVYQERALDTKDKYAVYYGGNYGLVEASMQSDTGRRLLVIKDSYAHCFVPFAMQLFDEVDMLDLRYFNQSLSEYMEKGNYTDILFLYNASGFAEDTSLAKLLT
ncbi:MAG: DHHW family protein [Lachnospiraceae bacterium]|nr:DHHW family protein [Lachnospiraceae bacterium]